MLRAAIGAALCASVTWGCNAHNSPTSTTASRTGDPVASIEADTEMACSRTRSAGAWTQLVYRTATWRDLAERADRRDPEAWKEIGNLIERNRKHVENTVCTEEMLQNVRASATRLAGSR